MGRRLRINVSHWINTVLEVQIINRTWTESPGIVYLEDSLFPFPTNWRNINFKLDQIDFFQTWSNSYGLISYPFLRFFLIFITYLNTFYYCLHFSTVQIRRSWPCPNRSRLVSLCWRTSTSSSTNRPPTTCKPKFCPCSTRPSNPPLFKFR